jgi:hypothetical protein|tara:strand:+ start:223 stop:498 length:276 start_codon:yes stop_codon:yes gene_type:complete
MSTIKLKEFIEARKGDFDKDTELKTFLINFVGEYKKLSDDDEVTVEMIVEVMAQEFPEFILSVAEENFLRGYDQAIVDIEHLKGAVDNEPA